MAHAYVYATKDGIGVFSGWRLGLTFAILLAVLPWCHWAFAKHPLEHLKDIAGISRLPSVQTPLPVPLEWTPLGAGLNGPCNEVIEDGNGHVYVGGSFDQASGQVVNHVAMWNGSTWMALGSGMNDDVWGLALAPNGDLYAVGNFTQAGGQTVNYVARWNGSTWSALGSGLNAPAYAVVVAANGDVYVAGAFTQAGGSTAKYIARWNGSTWSALGAGLNDEAYALAIDNAGNVYVGGAFTQAGNIGAAHIAKWNGSTFFPLGSGTNGNCYAVHLTPTGMLYIGGEFTQAGNQSANRIAQWNGTNWSALGSGLSFWCMDIESSPTGTIYAAGLFLQAGGQTVNHIGAWDGSSWSALGGGTGDWVYALDHNGTNTLYAGGEFIYAGGVVANYVAQWTTQDPPPGCTFLANPTNGTTGVPRNVVISWNPVGNANGYLLTAGTCATCTDIANNLNVGNTTSYDPPGLLPCLTQIYVTITPYNANGTATGCIQESFTTVGVQAEAIPDQTICGSDSVQLWATGGVQYRWSPATGLSDPYVANPWASPSTTTTYQVTVFDYNGCSDVATTTVYVYPGPAVSVITTDETANAANDGTATALVSGGTQPYGYLWNTGDTTSTITNLAPGTYTVTVTDLSGCMVSASGTVDSFVCPALIPIDTFSHPFCADSCTGTIQIVEVQGAQPPLQYQWNNGLQGSSLSGLCAGTYAVTITDGANCSVVDSFLLMDTIQIAINVTATPETGYQFHDGTASVTASGGFPPYTFTWQTGDTTALIDNLAPGWYFVTVHDSVGCFAIDSVLVDTFLCPPQQFFLAHADATCPGLCNGQASIDSLASGMAPFTYVWSNGDTTALADSLCAGIWTVTVTDILNCSWTDTLILYDTLGIQLQFNVMHESANQAHNGRIEVIPSGGVPPFHFSWSTGDTTAVIDSLVPGIYAVTVTDQVGCTAIDSAQVLEFNCNDLTVQAQVSDALCADSCSGSATITDVSGGFPPFTYLWTNGDIGPMADSLCAGPIVVRITDSLNCSVSDTFLIGQPAPLTLALMATSESGLGFHDGTASAAADGGTPPISFFWSTGDTTAQIGGLAPGLYSVTVTDAHGCTLTDSVEVLPFVCPPLELALAQTPPSCHDACDGVIEILQVAQGTPPFTYQWSNGETQASVSNLCAGTYTVTVTDTLNCNLVDTIDLPAPPALEVSATSTPETANGTNDGTATAMATGGTPPYVFVWNTGDTTAQIGPVPPGIYSVTATDAHGCSDSTEVVVEAFGCPQLEIAATLMQAGCNAACDGSIRIDSVSQAVAPLSFLWSHGDTTALADSLCAGTWSVTVTDAFNCTAVASYTIVDPPPIVIAFDVTPEMSNGGADGAIQASIMSGSPPYHFLWNTGDTTTQLTNLAPGWYHLTVTDSMGCMAIDSVEVPAFVCPPLAIQLQIDSISCHNACDGAIAVAGILHGMAPFTYQWSNNATGSELSGLCAGTWSLTVTDALNCSVSDTITLLEPAPLIPHANATPETANDANDGTAWVAPTGGTPPYSVVWSTGDTTFVLDSLPPDIYLVQVTDAHGCVATQNVFVVEFECPELEVQLNATPPFCADSCNGVVTVVGMTNGVMPFTYEWSTGAQTGQIAGLCPGTYHVTVTDSKNCSASDAVTLATPQPLVLETYHRNETGYNLSDGMAWVVVSGGTPPYGVMWSNGVMNQDTVGGLAPGTYEVMVTDVFGCMAMDTFTIQPFLCDSLWMESLTGNATCADSCNGFIEITAIHQGMPPYTYTWAQGDTLPALDHLCAGTYELTITDANNCMLSTTFTIEAPPPLQAWWTVSGESAPDAQDGTILVEVEGGTPPYAITWNTGDATFELDSLPAGDYAFTLTDSLGCLLSDTLTVAPFTCYDLEVAADALGTSCNNCTNGVAWAFALNGAAPYSWQWSNGATDSLLTGLPPGTYVVTIADAYGCTGTDTVTVTPFMCYTLELEVGAQSASCSTCTDGQAWATPLNGVPFYSWQWSNGATDSLLTDLPPGTYTVTVTDFLGCSGVDSVVVEAGPVQTVEPFRGGVRIMPNPFDEYFFVSLSQNAAQPIVVRLWSLTGQPLSPSLTLRPGDRTAIPTGHLPKGVYVLELIHPEGRWHQRMVKQ